MVDTRPLVPPALDPATVPARTGTAYPEQFRGPCEKRSKQALGNELGIQNFGVNLVRLEPGSWSSQRHWHTREDEFVFVLEGEITLITDVGEQLLRPGTAAGFPKGKADGHHLVNRTDRVAVYLEVGDRAPDDEVSYPDIDLRHADFHFRHKSGQPY